MKSATFMYSLHILDIIIPTHNNVLYPSTVYISIIRNTSSRFKTVMKKVRNIGSSPAAVRAPDASISTAVLWYNLLVNVVPHVKPYKLYSPALLYHLKSWSQTLLFHLASFRNLMVLLKLLRLSNEGIDSCVFFFHFM